jgi:2-oxoglutarate dehydrogenase E2 component (dihydrolipoamide succinyltransferase)
MSTDIIIPSLGESVVEATIGNILKPNGTIVRVDEEILEIETEKVNQMLYAPAAGALQLNVQTGDRVKIGQVIGSIAVSSEAAAPSATSAPRKSKAAVTPTAPAKPIAGPKGSESRQKMSALRRTIAERLVEVKNQTAMLTTFNEVDLSLAVQLRQEKQESFQQKYGVKLGFMGFFVKATLAALKEYPAINGRIEGDEIVYHNYYNIGIAVGTDKGLLVPVLRNIENLSLGEIEQKIKEYADKARTGAISIDDLQGGTFTITNGGVYGSLFSTPILNPPQSGILGMHQIVKRPVVVNDQIVISPMMYLALSYDHRIVDGKEAISFLVRVKKYFEDPNEISVD